MKVGTFQVINGAKQGGNVASYFCLGDGSVLHAIAGPVNAQTLLREARWVVETRKLAIFESRNNPVAYREFIRKAHLDRLRAEQGIDATALVKITRGNGNTTSLDLSDLLIARLTKRSGNQGQIHALLAQHPLVKIEQIYRVVFERILGEKISTLPVAQRGN